MRVPVRRFNEFETVADRNCVAVKRGGEHREANGRSETQVNSIRPVVAASLQVKGEADVPYRTSRDVGCEEIAARGLNRNIETQTQDISGDGGWLESERLEGSIHETKRSGQATELSRSQRNHSSDEVG